MGGIIGSCAGACAATCACQGVKTCCSIKSKGSRVPYLLMLFFSVISAVILRYWGHPVMVKIYFWSWGFCTSGQCQGYSAVFRISWAIFLFFFMMACLMWSSAAAKIDSQMWFTKFLLFATFVTTAFFIPNEFFFYYGQFARVFSGIFLILQVLIIIDFAYALHERWWNEETQMKWAILGITLGSYGLSLAAFILLYMNFTDDPDAGLKKFFIIFTLLITLAFSMLSLGSNSTHGMMPASIITLYSYYLLYSALTSDPSWIKETAGGNETIRSQNVHVILGIVVAALSITYSGWSAANAPSVFDVSEDPDANGHQPLSGSESSSKKKKDKEKIESGGAVTMAINDSETGNGDKNDSDDEDGVLVHHTPQEIRNFFKFHAIMALASLYMAMVLTDWGMVGDDKGTNSTWGMASRSTVWIKISSQWLTLGLFAWSLFAPYLCPERFGVDDDDE